ncbi:MAG: ParB/RepB/Spo0J family partition protein [Clostridiales bacterium]|nr:ParB/RepB/Spo0J family partition protein [Clostridiales bacterium]
MANNKGLGKGLSALFSSTEEDYKKTFGVTEEDIKTGVLEIKIADIYPNPSQPRKVFDPKALDELASSIKVNGVIMPIVLNKDENGKYMIIAGERRFRASKMVGLETIPAIIKDYDERKIQEISLIENLQREDLNPIESATAMKQLMDDYGLTQEELSERIGKSRSAIANTLRLLSLDAQVIKMVSDGKLSQGHARALVTLPIDAQVKIAKKSVSDGMSVRDIEREVKDYFNPPEEKKRLREIKRKQDQSAELKDLISRMQQVLGTKVQAIGNDKKGRIYIDYYTTDDLDRICDIIEFLEKNQSKIR